MIQGSNKKERGQAAIEFALALPFLIWLLFYLLNGYYTVHTAHIGQKYAAMGLWQRVNHRSKFIMDDVAGSLHGKEFMAVQSVDAQGQAPVRKMVRGPVSLNTIVGICREPNCNR